MYSDFTRLHQKVYSFFVELSPKMTLNLLFLVHDELSTHLLNLKPGFIQGQWFLLRVLPRVFFGSLEVFAVFAVRFAWSKKVFKNPDISWMDISSNNKIIFGKKTIFQSTDTIGGLFDMILAVIEKTLLVFGFRVK